MHYLCNMKTNCLANLNAGACFLQRVAYIFVFNISNHYSTIYAHDPCPTCGNVMSFFITEQPQT